MHCNPSGQKNQDGKLPNFLGPNIGFCGGLSDFGRNCDFSSPSCGPLGRYPGEGGALCNLYKADTSTQSSLKFFEKS